MSASHASSLLTANQILSVLPRLQYPLLFPKLEPVHLARGRILHNLAEPISSAFFIMSGMVSLMSITEDGSTTQIGMVGNEGVVGIPAVLRVNKAPYQAIVQIPGKAMRVRIDLLTNEFNRGDPLQDLLLRYIHALISQISQSAACNRFHSIEERLCRWLLISHDRIKSNTLQLTQEALSHMLGATRPNVTSAAISLRGTGLINYHHGSIRILDRQGLERAACECYRVITKEIGSFRAA